MDHDRYRVVKWAHMLGDMGQYHPISGDITRYRAILGRYRAISEDFGVISSSVKSVMYLARQIQGVPGQLIF